MAQLTAEQVERTIETCRAHLPDLRDTFRTNLNCDVRFAAAEPRPYAAHACASAFAGPGLAVSLFLGEQGLLFLIPEPLPLPAWYRQPGISENNRLQSFAHELSMQLLPADLQADRYAAIPSTNLKELAEQAEVNPAATMLELSVLPADAGDGDRVVAKILVVVPVDAPPPGAAAPANQLPESTHASADAGTTEPATRQSDRTLDPADPERPSDEPVVRTGPHPAVSLDEALRALRVLRVPVTVSVRLAERKLPMGQIAALVPGALITFNKSCEELLDLFVNNQPYCRGEAVKIGENFGLKIAKLGVPDQRKEPVI